MHSFTDADGRIWQLAIDVNTIRRVRGLVKDIHGQPVDLTRAVGGDLCQQMWADPVLLVDVLWAICAPQAGQLGISDETFGCAMRGDAIDGATEALLEELVDFFPQQQRLRLRQLLEKSKQLQATMETRLGQMVDSPEIDQAIEQAIQLAQERFDAQLRTFGGLSTSSPASSASTPDR